jgi:hypothetical protein
MKWYLGFFCCWYLEGFHILSTNPFSFMWFTNVIHGGHFCGLPFYSVKCVIFFFWWYWCLNSGPHTY